MCMCVRMYVYSCTVEGLTRVSARRRRVVEEGCSK